LLASGVALGRGACGATAGAPCDACDGGAALGTADAGAGLFQATTRRRAGGVFGQTDAAEAPVRRRAVRLLRDLARRAVPARRRRRRAVALAVFSSAAFTQRGARGPGALWAALALRKR